MKYLLSTLLLIGGLLPAAPLCAQTPTDTDNDGIPDAQDNCPEGAQFIPVPQMTYYKKRRMYASLR